MRPFTRTVLTVLGLLLYAMVCQAVMFIIAPPGPGP